MFRRLLLLGVTAILAAGSKPTGPSEFYVVTVSFSDDGALFYYRVLDVKPDGAGSIVRYTRIAPRTESCPRKIVQSVEARVPSTTPSQLVGRNNPCAVAPGDLKSAVKHYARRAGVFEAVSFGVVAHCGAGSISLALPTSETMKWKSFEGSHPEMARLWDLSPEVSDRVFGSKEIFHDRTEEDDLTLQQDGEKIIPELIDGRYDAGLIAAFNGNVGHSDYLDFRSLLEDYHGPISISEARIVPRLLNADQYQFTHFTEPTYPPLAKQARIQGQLELQLTVVQATGEVSGVAVVSGHPLLKDSAIAAAKQWRFAPNFATSEIVNITLDFTLRCPQAP